MGWPMPLSPFLLPSFVLHERNCRSTAACLCVYDHWSDPHLGWRRNLKSAFRRRMDENSNRVRDDVATTLQGTLSTRKNVYRTKWLDVDFLSESNWRRRDWRLRRIPTSTSIDPVHHEETMIIHRNQLPLMTPAACPSSSALSGLHPDSSSMMQSYHYPWIKSGMRYDGVVEGQRTRTGPRKEGGGERGGESFSLRFIDVQWMQYWVSGQFRHYFEGRIRRWWWRQQHSCPLLSNYRR